MYFDVDDYRFQHVHCFSDIQVAVALRIEVTKKHQGQWSLLYLNA